MDFIFSFIVLIFHAIIIPKKNVITVAQNDVFKETISGENSSILIPPNYSAGVNPYFSNTAFTFGVLINFIKSFALSATGLPFITAAGYNTCS